MKKFISVILLAALVLTFCACSSNDGGTSSDAADVSSSEVNSAVSAEANGETSGEEEISDGKVSYTVYVVDEDGNGIPNVPVQLCLTSCYPGKTDENGKAVFSLVEGDYHAQIMKMPEGYIHSGEATEFYFESGKTEMTIVLKSASEESSIDGDDSSSSALSSEETTVTEGTKDNPIGCFPDLGSTDTVDVTVTLPTIPANGVLYFSLYRIGGRVITINDANAYVIYNDVKYTPVNGKVQFVAEDVMADRAITVQVGNTSSAGKSFVLNCAAIVGTYDNPQIITTLSAGSFTSHLQEGNDQGYYCKYIAESTGTLRLQLESATNNAKVYFIVTNQVTYANRSNGEDGEFEGENYVEVAVSEGDEILIVIGAEPVKRVYPETDAVWSGSCG